VTTAREEPKFRTRFRIAHYTSTLATPILAMGIRDENLCDYGSTQKRKHRLTTKSVLIYGVCSRK
jgi:hypothetical protein